MPIFILESKQNVTLRKIVIKNKYVVWTWFFLLLALPIVLWLLPSDFFDHEKMVFCPSRALLDLECWGCGITRAVMHFHHFEVADAAYYNRLVFVVYPLLIFIWFLWVKGTARRLRIFPNLTLAQS